MSDGKHRPEFTHRAHQSPEEAEFHKTLLADPSDVTTRLVYADYCEEHGRLDKATWLRNEGEGGARGWFAACEALHSLCDIVLGGDAPLTKRARKRLDPVEW